MLDIKFCFIPLEHIECEYWKTITVTLSCQEAEEEDRKCADELESLEKHKQLLEGAVNEGLSEAVSELVAGQRV